MYKICGTKWVCKDKDIKVIILCSIVFASLKVIKFRFYNINKTISQNIILHRFIYFFFVETKFFQSENLTRTLICIKPKVICIKKGIEIHFVIMVNSIRKRSTILLVFFKVFNVQN